MGCNLCPQFLPQQVMGRGPAAPKLIVLGDHPNGDDEASGKAFSAGRNPHKDYPNLIIPRVLEAIGMSADDVYFAYALRCNVWHRAKPIPVKPQHLATCRVQNLDPELTGMTCPVILACGDMALKSLLPEATGGVGHNRGRWHETTLGGQKRLVRVTYAPKFVHNNSLFLAAELPNGKIVPTDRWNPPGSCGWLFQKDIAALRLKLRELGLLVSRSKVSQTLHEEAS